MPYMDPIGCVYIYIQYVYIYFLQVKMTSFFNAEPLNG